MKLKRPYRKLDCKRVGPFMILKLINRLKFPETVRTHPAFHVSLLVAYKAPIKGQMIKRPVPIT